MKTQLTPQENLAQATLTRHPIKGGRHAYRATFGDGTTMELNSKVDYKAALLVVSKDGTPRINGLSRTYQGAATNPRRKWDAYIAARPIPLTE